MFGFGKKSQGTPTEAQAGLVPQKSVSGVGTATPASGDSSYHDRQAGRIARGEESQVDPGGHVGGVPDSENEPGMIQPSFRGDEDDDFQFNVRQLPQGVIVKRVFPRDNKSTKNHYAWRAGYQASNGRKLRTEYYGETLDIAISELFKNHQHLLEAYNLNGAIAKNV